jgi:hypothetical protein
LLRGAEAQGNFTESLRLAPSAKLFAVEYSTHNDHLAITFWQQLLRVQKSGRGATFQARYSQCDQCLAAGALLDHRQLLQELSVPFRKEQPISKLK